jgi:polyisoprenoid-binding protein YceI
MNMKKHGFIFASIAAFALGATAPQAIAEDAATPSAAVSGTYQADPGHRYITFSYLHVGYSRPMLRWRDWDATLDWDADNPSASNLSVVIDATSIDSGVDEFDGHLNGDRFFDTANHPEITFVSTKLVKTGDTTGIMTGDLTIKGITKPIDLDVTLNRTAKDDFFKIYKIGFTATGTVKRTDYGMDYAVPVVSDEVEINIQAEFNKPLE